MKAYKYDIDGFFQGSCNVQKNPAGEGYLLPDRATLVKPEISTGHKAQWDGENWNQTAIDYEKIEADLLAAKMARTKFSKLEILEAFNSLGLKQDLLNLLSGNVDFNAYWVASNIIDLEHPVAILALANFSDDELNVIKGAIA